MSLKEKAERLHNKGMNLTEIGRQLGVSRQSVAYHLRHVERKSHRKKPLNGRKCQNCGKPLTDKWFNYGECLSYLGSDPWTENEHCVGV